MSKAEARDIAVKAFVALYESKWDENNNHGWGEYTTWEIKDEVIEALRKAFK